MFNTKSIHPYWMFSTGLGGAGGQGVLFVIEQKNWTIPDQILNVILILSILCLVVFIILILRAAYLWIKNRNHNESSLGNQQSDKSNNSGGGTAIRVRGGGGYKFKNLGIRGFKNAFDFQDSQDNKVIDTEIEGPKGKDNGNRKIPKS